MPVLSTRFGDLSPIKYIKTMKYRKIITVIVGLSLYAGANIALAEECIYPQSTCNGGEDRCVYGGADGTIFNGVKRGLCVSGDSNWTARSSNKKDFDNTSPASLNARDWPRGHVWGQGGTYRARNFLNLDTNNTHVWGQGGASDDTYQASHMRARHLPNTDALQPPPYLWGLRGAPLNPCPGTVLPPVSFEVPKYIPQGKASLIDAIWNFITHRP
jgi:hypothetical protein